jgi:hypothetical protein
MVAFPEKTPPARGIHRCDPIWVVTHARRHAHDDAQAVEASWADAGVDRHRGSRTGGSWFRAAQAAHEDRTRAVGVEKNVVLEDAGDDVNDAVVFTAGASGAGPWQADAVDGQDKRRGLRRGRWRGPPTMGVDGIVRAASVSPHP